MVKQEMSTKTKVSNLINRLVDIIAENRDFKKDLMDVAGDIMLLLKEQNASNSKVPVDQVLLQTQLEIAIKYVKERIQAPDNGVFTNDTVQESIASWIYANCINTKVGRVFTRDDWINKTQELMQPLPYFKDTMIKIMEKALKKMN